MSTKILITGASGFLGSALVRSLSADPQYNLTAAARSNQVELPATVALSSVRVIDATTDWTNALDVDVIIHAAARVHVMNEAAADPLARFREVNTAGTLNLATQAARAGVKRFIFISSIKVNGESTQAGERFQADDRCAPADPYAISKYEAEQALIDLASATGLEVVIIRPVLVYGPGVKANFLQLMRIVRRGIPLPLGAIDNARSLVSLGNLVDLVRVCIAHPQAADQTFLVSDDHDVSTPELIRRLGKLLGVPTRLLPVPAQMIFALAKLARREPAARRVLGSLQVDISKTRTLLNWTPPMSLDEGLSDTVAHFIKTEKR
jgi:nucleoside-diphosphate-sugar epimerase